MTNAALKDNELEAIRLVGVYTARSFRIDCLIGPAKSGCRAHIMSMLLNVKVPQSKSGYNALRDGLNRLSGVTGGCIASQEEELIHWCKSIETQHGWKTDRNYGRKNA